VDKCDETVTSLTTSTISVNLTLAASMERGTGQKDLACISRCRCYTGSMPAVCPFRAPIADSVRLLVQERQRVLCRERALHRCYSDTQSRTLLYTT